MIRPLKPEHGSQSQERKICVCRKLPWKKPTGNDLVDSAGGIAAGWNISVRNIWTDLQKQCEMRCMRITQIAAVLGARRCRWGNLPLWAMNFMWKATVLWTGRPYRLKAAIGKRRSETWAGRNHTKLRNRIINLRMRECDYISDFCQTWEKSWCRVQSYGIQTTVQNPKNIRHGSSRFKARYDEVKKHLR